MSAFDFNPRSPHGERQVVYQRLCCNQPFQSTLPARGATPRGGRTRRRKGISIHAPRTGSDRRRRAYDRCKRYFNPRSPHGERPEKPPAAHQPPEISIHAPRTGSDPAAHQPPEEAEISIHAPRTGSDASPEYRLVRETRYFNPRSPHGERRAGKNRHETGRLISIHAPRTGSDTTRRTATHKRRRISIHAPRTGSDLHAGGRRAGHGDFNPRSPHGERLPSATRAFGTYRFQSTLPARGATKWTALKGLITEFQSTLPARGATCPGTPSGFAQKISIHAPRTGSDKRAARTICATPHFNPRSPHGERPQNQAAGLRLGNFNPRSPHGERLTGSRYFSFSAYFNPRSPHGERPRPKP